MVPPGSMCKYDLSLRSYPLNQSRVARHERMMAAKACSIMDSKLLCKLATTRKVNFIVLIHEHILLSLYISAFRVVVLFVHDINQSKANSNFSSSEHSLCCFFSFIYFSLFSFSTIFLFFCFLFFFATME